MDIQSIHKALSTYRFTLENEKALQLQIEQALTAQRIVHSREHFLDEHNIIDFLAGDGVGIEVKIKGSKRDIYAQILRYSNFQEIRSVLLVTNKSFGSPLLFENKRLMILNLGQAWL